MSKQEVFFPYGISNFAQIATQNYVYVDKTRFIELLEKKQERYVSFLRPRRFGKSLFVSLLEHYYDIRRKNQFQELFSKYYIGKNPTPLANSYRILFFNFSAISTSTPEESYQEFLKTISLQVRAFCMKYHLFNDEIINEIGSQSSPDLVVKSLFELYAINHSENKIYLLIDEYDHFTNEILIRSIQEFKETVSSNGYVRKFYEALKNATQLGVIERFFITGVSPMTMDSLTSGFNIVSHLTLHKDFETMMGFEEAEVRYLLNLTLQNPKQEDAILNDLREYYNGYKFYPFSNNSIYNSDMVLYFLKHFKDEQMYPFQMLDPNIAPDYGKLKQMFKVANWQNNITVLQEVLENGFVQSEIIYQFNFENDFSKKDFINFLFYLGNLTIQETAFNKIIRFKMPNKVIAQLYWHYYAELLYKNAQLLYSFPDDIQMAVADMALSGDFSKFFSLVEKLLQNLSNRDFLRFDEKHIKMAIIAYLIQANIFNVISERETQNGNYIDIELCIAPNNPFKHQQFAIELKYLKKEDEHKLSQTMQEAKNQILLYYQNDAILQSKEMLNLVAVVVVKDKIFAEKVLFA